MLEGFTAPLSDTEPVTITQVIFPSPLTHLLMAFDSALAMSHIALPVGNYPIFLQQPDCGR